MVKSIPTQNERILGYIAKHGSITQLEALTECSVMRLASRVSDLRSKGFPIEGRTVKVKNKFGETCYVSQYSLGDGKDHFQECRLYIKGDMNG